MLEKSGALERCTDVVAPPGTFSNAEAARAWLYTLVTEPRKAERVVSGSCSESFRERRALATCVIAARPEDGGGPHARVTHHYYLMSACARGSKAEKACKKAGGAWQIADPEEPAVATERTRQSVKSLLQDLQRATRP